MLNQAEIFCERKLDFCPDHFVKCKTPLSKDSYSWIINNLTGRYAFNPVDSYSGMMAATKEQGFYLCTPAFEDPAEATFYELTWS